MGTERRADFEVDSQGNIRDLRGDGNPSSPRGPEMRSTEDEPATLSRSGKWAAGSGAGVICLLLLFKLLGTRDGAHDAREARNRPTLPQAEKGLKAREDAKKALAKWIVEARAKEVGKVKLAREDVPFLTFGKVIEATAPQKVDWKNPHHATAYAVWMCRQGRIKELVKEMGYVQEDEGLGKAWLEFLEGSGPDLERYKDKELYLKFHGYYLNAGTSVWCYYLATKDGENLTKFPWVSTQRSRTTSRCALTAIFLHDPADKNSPGDVPENLLTSLEKK